MQPDATGNLFYIDSILKWDIYFSNFEFYACLRRGVIGNKPENPFQNYDLAKKKNVGNRRTI